MKFNKFIIALLVIAMIVSVGAVSATDDIISANDAGDSVVSTDDSGVVKYYVDSNVAETGDGSQSSPFKTISEAVTIVKAANVTEIYLADGVYNSTGDKSLYLNLNHANGGNLSLIGSGENTVIDLMNSGYFMDSRGSNSKILLKDLTICNGKYSTYGVIRNYGSLTLDTVNVYNSQETRNNYNSYIIGGSGTVTVLNSKFVNNTGGIGVIYNAKYVFNSTFINNSALATSSSGGGGAIRPISGAQVIESTFINNTAKNGGAIYANVLDVYNSTFINNKADNYGGAIFISGGIMENNIFINNSALVAGGAIYANSGTLTTSNNIVENCVSPKDNYIYFSDLSSTKSKLHFVVMDNESSTINSVNIKVYASIFDEEGRPVSGASLKFLMDGNSLGTAEAINGTANFAVKRYLNGTHIISVSLPNSDCDVKTASIDVTPLDNIDVYISPDGDDENGDGSKENPYKTFDKGFDEANSAVNGILYIKNGVYEITKSYDINSLGNFSIIAYEGNATLDLGNLTDFRSTTSNMFAAVKGNVSIYNVTFINAHSTSSLTLGRLFDGETLKLDGCSFINNTCSAYMFYLRYMDINSCYFMNNAAGQPFYIRGGKITNSYIDDVGKGGMATITASGTSELIIDNCEFNTVYIQTYSDIPLTKITNSKFYGNLPDQYAISTGGKIAVDNCTFVGQSKNSIHINDNMAHITNCTFINNTGTQSNVAIYYNSNSYDALRTLYLSNNTVISSTADYYVYLRGYISSPYTYVVLGNESIDVESFGYKFTAIGYDDVSNKINFENVYFYLNDTRLGIASYDNEGAYLQYKKALNGTYIVSAKSQYIDDAFVKTATLKIAPLNVEVWVSNDGNDENDGSEAHPLKTLEKATSYYAYITIIHICPGTYTIEDSLLFDSRDVYYYISGAGINETIIDLNHEHRFITNELSNVNIANMTILNGYQFDDGWYMSLAGVIYNTGTLNIDSVNFINSTSENYCYGGAIYNEGEMNISNSNFINSSAADGCGGAIYNSGHLRISNSTFINSSAEEGGAAIYSENYLYIKNITIEDADPDYICSYGTVDGVTLIFNDNETCEITELPAVFSVELLADGIPISGSIPITFTLNGNDVGSASIEDGVATLSSNKKYGGEYILSGKMAGAENLIIKTATLNYNIAGLSTDIWVSTEGDDENGNGSRDNPYATIQKALTMAYDVGTTIHMLKGNYVFNQVITISTAISIVGEEDGVIFNGSSSKFFRVNANSELTLKNITFVDSKSNQMIYDAGVLTIDNCIFENNTGNSAQFLIYCEQAELNVYNSIFRNNDVKVTGNNLNGILIHATGDVRFANTSFYNNTCPVTDGLIYLENYMTYDSSWREYWTDYDASFVNCTFKDNTQPAIRAINYDISIKDSVFTNQTGDYVIYLGLKRGGWSNVAPSKIYLLNITNSNFTYNNVNEAIVRLVNFNGNIENNVFANNTGCLVRSGSTGSNSPSYVLTVKDNVLFNNSDNAYGNYIYTDSSFKIKGSKYILTFNNNESTVILGNELVVNATLVDIEGNIINGVTIKFNLNETSLSTADIIDGIAVLTKFTPVYGKYVLSGSTNSPVFDEGDLSIYTAEIEIIPIDHKIIYVDVFGDDETGDGSEDNPYASLSRAFEDVKGINNTIYIKPGVYSGESNNNNVIEIPPDTYLEIIGLSEFGDNVVFKNVSDRFLLLQIALPGGIISDFASERLNYVVKDICIEDSTFDNYGFIQGGTFSNILIDNIKFINSTVCGLVNSAYNITVLNVDVDLNSPSSNFVTGNGYVSLVNCSFKNSPSGSYSFICGGYCEIINSTFANLSVNLNSVPFIASYGPLNIVNSTFTNIAANILISTNFNTYYGNTYSYLDNRIYGSIFDSNNLGAGLFTIYQASSLIKNLVISNCVILNTTKGYNSDVSIFTENGVSHIDAYDNWFGNNDVILNPNVKLNYDMTKWIIVNVNASDVIVGEEAIFDIYFTSNDGTELEDIVPTRLVEVILGDEIDTYELEDNGITVYCTPESVGDLTIRVDGQEFTYEVEKSDVELDYDEIIDYDSPLLYEAFVLSGDEYISNATVIITINGKNYIDVSENGFVLFDLSDLSAGIYNVTYEIEESERYNSANGTFELTINKVSPDISIIDVEDGIIELDVPEEIALNIHVYVDDDEYSVIYENDTVYVDASDLAPGEYTVIIYYSGGDNYNSDVVVDTISIPKEDVELDVDVENSTVIVELPEDATGYVFVDVGNQSYYSIIEDGVAVIEITGLKAGTYEATIIYAGDDTYNEAGATANVTIPEKVFLDPELEISVNGTTITISLNENATGILIIAIGEKYGGIGEFDGEDIIIDLSELDAGNYTVEVVYLGDDVFANASAETSVIIPGKELLDPELEVSVNDTFITVSINENATGLVIVGVGEVAFVYDAEDMPVYIIDVSDFVPGTYDVIVTYLGDDVFANATANATVTVPEIVPEDPELEVSVNDTFIAVSLNENATGIVIVGVGEVAFVYDAEDAPVNIIDVSGFVPGTYDVVVTYLGDEVFDGAEANATVTVPEKELQDPELNVTVGDMEVIISLNENATGYVLVTFNEEDNEFYVYDGEDIVIDLFIAGNYTVEVTYLGDENFYGDYDVVNITVPLILEDPELNVTVENTTITVTINENATGMIIVYVGEIAFIYDAEDAPVNIIDVAFLPADTYEVVVFYDGDDVFEGDEVNATVTVPEAVPENPEFNVSIANDTITVTVNENATGYVLIDVDGIGFYTTIENGEATFELPILTPGNYTIDITYTGDRVFDSASASVNITIEGPVETIISEDLTKVEKAPDRFEAVFLDEMGGLLINQTVSFTLNGVTYNRTTDASGKAGMNINLIAGNYQITITNPVTGEVKVNNITVMPRIVENTNLVKYFRNASQFIVKVLDDEGNPVKAGEVVTFNINGVFYNRTTNSSGQVKLSINLNPGDYVITTSYKGCVAANNVTVLPTLTANDLTKKYGQPGAFEAKLVDGQGKALANAEVTFNINGVLYKRSTNATGIAKLNINLVAGEYVITTMANGAVISNKVTITP